MKSRAVFLDRDGVLNRAIVRNGKPYPPASAKEMEIPPGTREALDELKRRGFLLIVVTNQPDVGRGAQSCAALDEIHARIRAELPVDDIFSCLHQDADACECRKPKPGMLRQAERRYGLDLGHSFLIGDRWRDIDAGRAAGCKTVLIDYGYREQEPAWPPDGRVSSLPEAIEWIVTKGDHIEESR